MRLFGYYAFHSFVNQLRKLLKTWVLVFLVACMAIGGIIGISAARLEEMNEEQNGAYTAAGDISELPPEVQEMISEGTDASGEDSSPEDGSHAAELISEKLGVSSGQLMRVLVALITLAVLTVQVLGADKNGSRIFLPADVPLLFASPMRPQSVLLFRLMTQMGLAIFMTIYMFIQIPNLTLNLGLSLSGAIGLIVSCGLAFIAGKLLQLLLYMVAATNEGSKQWVRYAVYALLALLAIGYFAYWKLSGLSPIAAAAAIFASKAFGLLPIWGWIASFGGLMSEGRFGLALLVLAAIFAGAAILILIVYRIPADFYEDAMAKSEQMADLMEQMASDKSGKLYMNRNKKDRSEKLRRDGLNHGRGASVFFFKSMYNRFRFAKLGIFTKTSVTYLLAALGICAFQLLLTDFRSIEPVALVLGGLAFFRAMGNPLEEDTGMDFFVTIPSSSWAKLFFSMLGGTANCLLDMLPAMVLACLLLRADPLVVLFWMLFIVTLDAYASTVGAFINLSVPVSAGKTIKQVVQIMFIYFGLLPDILIIAIGYIMDSLYLYLAIASGLNIILSLLFLSLTPLFVEPGNGRTFRNEPGVCMDLKSARRSFSTMGFGICAFLAISMIAQMVFAIWLSARAPELMSRSWMIYVMSFVPMYGLGLPAAASIIRSVPARRSKDRAFGAFNMFKTICISIFAMYSLNYLTTALLTMLEDSLGLSEANPIETLISGDDLWIRILVVAILGPLVEEFVFRRLLIDRMNIYGEKLAVITSAIAFGLFHGNLHQCFYAAGLGLVFGYIYVRTGRLRYSAVLHMIVNFSGSVIAPMVLESLPPEMLEADTAEIAAAGLSPETMPFFLYIGCLMILGVMGFIFLVTSWKKLSFDPVPQEIPRGSRTKTAWGNLGMLFFVLVSLIMMALNMFQSSLIG